jgi:hypothetical protein
MIKQTVFLLFICLNVNAGQVMFAKVDLSGSGTALNKCIVEKIKVALPPSEEQKVVETGFAFSGTFTTHPLFSSVPVLFVSYQTDVDGTQNEVTVVRDIHVAIPSFQRYGWQPNFQEQTVSAMVDGEAYVSVIEENNNLFQDPLRLDISSCWTH